MNYTDNSVNEIKNALNPGPVPEIVNKKLAQAYAELKTLPSAKKRSKKLFRSLLAAAALCCAVSVTALAANKELQKMLQGAISFFSQSSSSGTGSLATTTIDSIKQSFEAMNAAVNLSATDKDFTFTVQNISIDDNFINIFGTISSPDLRNKISERITDGQWEAGETPDAYLLSYLSLSPVAKIDGKLYGLDNSLNDSFNAYFIDDNTVGFADRMLVNDKLPDTFTIQLQPDYYTTPDGEFQKICGVDGSWTISADIDLTSTNGNVKALQAQEIAFADTKLDLKKFSASPLGTIAVVDSHESEYDTIDENGESIRAFGPMDGFSTIYSYALRDSEGKWLYPMTAAAHGSRETMTEFTPPSENASSVTFVPLKLAGAYTDTQWKTVPLVQGSKIEMNSLSGYTIESYKIEGRHFEMRLMPYGPACRGNIGQKFDLLAADGLPAYDEMARLAIMDAKTDHLTGAVVFTMDFYRDQPKLQTASQLKYPALQEFALDEENAVTLPFN